MVDEKTLHELQVHKIELEMQNEELRQAHIALEESRDKYLDLFEFAPIGYFTLTATGLIAEVNFTGAELLGVERKKLLLRPFSRHIAPDCCDQFHLRLSRLMRDEEQQSYDLQIQGKDDERSVHVHALRVKAEDGTITLRITLTDITESKRIEAALKESEQRLTFAFEGSGDGMWDWDVETGKVNYSKQWKKMIGFTDAEIKNDFKEWQKLVHPEDLPKAMADIQVYLKGNTVAYANEHRLMCKDGSYKWILTRGKAVTRAPDGTPARIIGTHADITTQKEVEQNLRITAVAFESQEGIMVTDIHCIIQRVNNAFTRITGYTAEEAVGQPASLLKSGRHNAVFYQSMWELIARNHCWQGELWDKRKNKEVFPVWMTITAVIGANGEIANYVGSFSDITLKKQAEKVLLDARQDLERQVEKATTELTSLKGETAEFNTALKVMMKMRHTENDEAKNLLTLELQQEVLPFLQKLKSGNHDSKQIRLISTLEANLQRLVSTYGSETSIASSYKHLTPKEIQVATMVREGFSTKAIASTLSLSAETISIHRNNIRKKFGLDSKSDNLRSYLI